MLEIFVISLLRCLLIYFLIVKIVLGPMSGTQLLHFATLKIELYRVVDYDSKWSTKFHKDCILDFLFNFQNSI